MSFTINNSTAMLLVWFYTRVKVTTFICKLFSVVKFEWWRKKNYNAVIHERTQLQQNHMQQPCNLM